MVTNLDQAGVEALGFVTGAHTSYTVGTNIDIASGVINSNNVITKGVNNTIQPIVGTIISKVGATIICTFPSTASAHVKVLYLYGVTNDITLVRSGYDVFYDSIGVSQISIAAIFSGIYK